MEKLKKLFPETRIRTAVNNQEFEKKIDYSFNDKGLLNKALTHSSYCRENNMESSQSNERLEFLGDAFLDAITGAELYDRLFSVNEGKLTKTRALVVCEKSLAKVGTRLQIGDYLNMGNGEKNNGGRQRESIVADAMEAVIGAIFLDSGYENTREFVLGEFHDIIEDALAGRIFADYKTEIQEILQSKGTVPVIKYVLDKEEGPDHDKTFYVHLVSDDRKLGSGIGKSKKEAEQNAAKDTLEGGYI